MISGLFRGTWVEHGPLAGGRRKRAGIFVVTPWCTPTQHSSVFQFFTNDQCLRELSVNSGRHVVFYVPEEYKSRDVERIYAALEGGDYPELNRADLPCLWISDQNDESFKWPLRGRTPDDLMHEMSVLVDAAQVSANARELGKRMARALPEESSMPPHERPFAYGVFASLLFVFVVVLLILFGIAAKLDVFQDRDIPLAVYLILALIPSVVLFGALRTAGMARGQFFSWYFQFGGPAAMYVLVLFMVRFLQSPDGSPETFSVTVTLSPTDSNVRSSQLEGRLRLMADPGRWWPVKEGYADVSRVPRSLSGTETRIDLEVDRFRLTDPQKAYPLRPNGRIELSVEPVGEMPSGR